MTPARTDRLPRVLLAAGVLLAAAGPASEILAGAVPAAHRWAAMIALSLAVGGAFGTTLAAVAPPGTYRTSRSRLRRRLRLATLLLLAVFGTVATLPLLPLLTAGWRGRLRLTPKRLRFCLREILGAAVLGVLLVGGEASLLGLAGVVVLFALLLPVLARRAPAGGTLRGHRRRGPDPASGALLVATAAVAALLFVLLPRPGAAGEEEPTQLRRRAASARRANLDVGEGVVGMPQRRVHIGDIGRLNQDRRPVLEVLFRRGGRPAGVDDLGGRLRSGALERFDGLEWSAPLPSTRVLFDEDDGRADGWIELPDGGRPRGVAVEQELRFLAGGSDALFAIGAPVAVSGPGALAGVRALPRNEVQAAAPYAEDERYVLRSVADPARYPVVDTERLTAARRLELTAIPPGHDRVRALAASIGRDAADTLDLLDTVEAALTERCTYSLDIAAPGLATPLEAFLFESRRGHCELFASAAALLLRARGVPARIALGFRGGVPAGAPGLLRFRGSDAHAWVEVHVQGRGWVAFDPTPPPPGEDGVGVIARNPEPNAAAGPSILARVLGFDAIARRRFLRNLADAGATGLRAILVDARGTPRRWPWLLLAAAALATALVRLRGRGGRTPVRTGAAPGTRPAAPVPGPWEALERRLRELGVGRGPAETATDLVDRARGVGIGPERDLEAIAAAYRAERWGRSPPGEQRTAELRQRAAGLARKAATTDAQPS